MSLAKIFTSILFYLGLLTPFNWLANRVQVWTTAEGLLSFPIIRRRRNGNVQILTYHRVNDEHDPFFPAVPSVAFAKQMEYLASHFSVCSLTEAVERLRTNDIPDNVVVVTFDDGYRDNYLYAFPILKEYSVPATIFLATAAIGSGRVLWHDRVFTAFRKAATPVLRRFGQESCMYPLLTLSDKLFAQHAILQFLRSLGDEERSGWIDRLMTNLGVEDKEETLDLMLNWDEVRAMHQHGISFGSHTVTHPILSKLPVEKVKEEIRESQRTIAQQLGAVPTLFAYPNGGQKDFTLTTKQILRDTGYVCAVTTIFGANETGQDLFELRRGGPWETHLPTFAAKLNWYKCYTSR